MLVEDHSALLETMEGYEDISPLPLDTGFKDELCQIMYTDEYRMVVGTARALMERREYSERAKELTGRVIDLAPAYYTAWNYRFDILMHLANGNAELLNQELEWIDEVTLNNPKNYQIWSYKEAVLKNHPSPSCKRELPILQLMLDDDTKNYHVWSFRKWCILFFGDFTHELAYTEMLLERDVYNNSAWTHRMFVLKYTSPSNDHLLEEIEFVKAKIKLVPQNVSVWTYLRGLYENFFNANYDDRIVQFTKNFTHGVEDEQAEMNVNVEVESSFALEFLAHVYTLRGGAMIPKAIQAYKGLATRYDPIRKNMWERKIAKITAS